MGGCTPPPLPTILPSRYSQSVLTLFTTAKPFRGHIGVIQRNAIQSWRCLHPEIEIILFGNDEGAAQVAQEFSLRHEPRVECNELGTKRLDYLFARAQSIARHDVLCYINCDIILMEDFRSAVERVRAAHREFLMVGRRCDTDITTPLPFSSAHWQSELQALAKSSGRKRGPDWIDYFAFTRGLYAADIPPFVLRVYWDNWLVWKALASHKPVIDASRAVLAVHQNHDYSHHPQGQQGVWHGQEASDNARLAGGWRHLRTIADATQLLTPEELRNNTGRHWSTIRRYARQLARALYYGGWRRAWFALLNLTRPLRRGLRR